MIKDDKITLCYVFLILQRQNTLPEESFVLKITNKNILKKITLTLRRALCLVICLCALIPTITVSTDAAVDIPTAKDIVDQIEFTYSWAKRYTGYTSFKNYCAHYVNTQLLLLGINTRYVGGNGNDEYDNYKDLSYTGGGRKIHDYPATNATFKETLEKIAAQGDVVTDVLVGFQWTSTTAGKKYGHSFLIHGIIDGYVYFSDSFNLTLGGTYYKEGAPIKCTIDQLVAYYGRTSAYTLEGLIWFEDEELTAAMGGSSGNSGSLPADGSELGIYDITYNAGMRLRSGPGTGYTSLDVMPKGTDIYVIDIKGDWGYTYYNGKIGWVCLPSYTKRIGALPPFLVDTCEGDEILSRSSATSLADAMKTVKNTDRYSYTIIALTDIKLTSDLELGEGVALSLSNYGFDSGKHSLILSGGIVRASRSVEALKNNGFISESVSNGEYIYTAHTIDMAFTAINLVLNDNISLRFTANVDGISSMKDAKVVMLATDSAGIVSEYPADSSKSGTYVFTTDGIPARKMGDALTVQLCVRSSSLGSTGEIRSAAISYSPADYVRASYGSGARFDNLLSSMLNYGTEAQIYFNYNSSVPVNSILPENERALAGDSSVLVKANAAPVVSYDSTVHITSAQLVLLDNVALRLHSGGDSGDSKLTLLVWSESDYLALKNKAEKAGKDIASYLVKGNETYSLADEEGSFTLDDIPVKKFADTYYFRLCQTEGNKVLYDYVFSYSVTSYCADKLSDGVTEDIDRLCLAIAEYSANAREYFGYEING